MSEERKRLIMSFGAEIELVSHKEGGFLGSIAKSIAYKEGRGNVFLPSQFDNNYNIEAHYETTGPEIVAQMRTMNLNVDAFVAGVGTGGTIMGVARALKEKFPEASMHPLEPANSPILSTGFKVGSHRIQGISDEFIPSIVQLDQLDEIVEVDDGDAIIMAQKLAKQLGLGLGISSGANLLGALKVQEMKGKSKNVVTIFCDCNKKYLSTDLMNEIPVKSNYLSTDVKLIAYEIISCPDY